jgi:RNA polymerase primary sigma factor
MRRYAQHERRLRHTLGRDVQPAEVGASLGLSPHQSERLAGLIHSARGLEDIEIADAMGALSGTGSEVSVASVEDLVEQKLDQERLEYYLRRLSEREESFLRMRYGFYDGVAHTLQQTGDRFGVTRERVRQIEKRALGKLKRWLDDGEGGVAA